MKPENKSTGLGPTFCRDGLSKHRRLRHRKEIAHQTQRSGTGLTIFLRLGSSDMSMKKGDCTKFGNNQQIDIADTYSDLSLGARSSGVLLPCCKLKKLDPGKGYKLKLLLKCTMDR